MEDEYWGLVLAGVGTVEACRRVGIGRKTGYRWRAERGWAGLGAVVGVGGTYAESDGGDDGGGADRGQRLGVT